MIEIYSKNAFDGENIQICPMPLIIKLQDREDYEFVSSRTLVIDGLWRHYTWEITKCHESKEYS